VRKSHFLYLFSMKNGRKKLAYGESPEDALMIMRIRLSESEMNDILPDSFQKITQRKLLDHIHELG